MKRETNWVQKIRNSIILLIIGFLIGLTFSCGEKEDSDNGTVVKDISWQGAYSSIPEALRKNNPIASNDAKKGGTLRIYSHQFPKSLNYYLEQFSTTAEIFQTMFEPLLEYHPITLEPIPHLASSWKISADKKKFTFAIDRNAKWSDGKPVTAKDVLFTYETLMNKENNTAVFRIGLARFEKPIVLSEYEVEFTQKEIHWSNFETVAHSLFILPEHHFKEKDFNKENFEFPVVSGPYELLSAKKGRYIRLRRRGDYWMRAYPFYKGSDNFDVLLFKVYTEEAVAFQAFKKGDIDIYPVYKAYTWVKEATGEPFDKNYIVKQKVYNDKPIGFQGWVFNMRRPPFDDVRVRKAIAHLVDRKLLVEKLAFNEYDLTDAYYTGVWPGNSTPNPPIDYDPAKARKLLSEAGWKPNAKGILEKGGKEFKFAILDRDKGTEKYFTVFIERAKELGIQASIDLTDLAEWSSRVDKYDFDMTWAAWGGGLFPDPEPMWFSKYADETGQNNLAGFKSSEVDKLIQEQKTEFNVQKRTDLLRKIDKALTKEVPYVLLWNTKSTRLLYWNRFGFPINPLGRFNGESGANHLWWLDENKSDLLNSNKKSKSAMPTYSPVLKYSPQL
ncbi:ABC transporter, substrate-binding protein, family 5 [Leptospira broomii serovar Hurstbridge str. 5399]|uniref:ABC transporter, substrate-binding protein, family 5 n=1 Tax=Leptospira broomii serovar Hurstbridge str. 5399 TaxID=1049789 RepID=T0FEH3_9LEPT|nr:ABC transporter, substrate-binding protein, family 5 [Leptospira broomii serovar Hurstbridge str. 5399]